MKLLLVEDDTWLYSRLRDDLSRTGYVVDVADNGVDAEQLGTQWPYDAVILDLGLPQRSGLEVLRNWRKRGNAVPVLILTARGAWREKVEVFDAGADDYVAKPFHVEELCARLGALIRHTLDARSPRAFSADWSCDRRGVWQIDTLWPIA